MGMSVNEFAAPRADATYNGKEIGDKVLGTVVYIGDWYEHTDGFGNTNLQIKVVLDVDGTLTNVYVPKGKPIADAISEAVRRAGATELAEGGTLGITHSSVKQLTKGKLRLYSATYEPPAPGSTPAAFDTQADEEDPF